jgi:hypothetical protein
MAKKTEVATENVSRETSTHPDGWVLVRALMRLQGADDSPEVEIGEEYWQPPEAAAYMAARGWVSIVGAPIAPVAVEAVETEVVEVERSDEWRD